MRNFIDTIVYVLIVSMYGSYTIGFYGLWFYGILDYVKSPKFREIIKVSKMELFLQLRLIKLRFEISLMKVESAVRT